MKMVFIGYEADDIRLQEASAPDVLVDHRPGSLDESEQAGLWRGLALAAPDIAWVRWTSCEPPNIPALRRFHVARPQTRIIVEIPNDLSLPDPGLGELVGMGIYDIVRASRSFTAVLDATPTYADVVQWQQQIGDGDSISLPETTHPKIIEKRVVSVNRPAIIVVRGVLPGAGTTRLALAVAWWLAEQGWDVALMEYFGALDKPSELARLDAYPHPPNLRYVPRGIGRSHPAQTLQALLSQRRAAFVILDAGVSAHVPELLFTVWDLQCVVCPPPSRWAQTPSLRNLLTSDTGDTLLPSIEAHTVQCLWGPLGEISNSVHSLPVVWTAWPPQGSIPEELGSRLRNILLPVLPDAIPTRWQRWRQQVRYGVSMTRWRRWVAGLTGGTVIGLFMLMHGWSVASHVVQSSDVRHWVDRLTRWAGRIV